MSEPRREVPWQRGIRNMEVLTEERKGQNKGDKLRSKMKRMEIDREGCKDKRRGSEEG